MTLTVHLFAAARDLVGHPTVVIDLSAGATVGDVRARLSARHPDLTRVLGRSAIAVNHEYAEDSHSVSPADEVAVIPPVSGG